MKEVRSWLTFWSYETTTTNKPPYTSFSLSEDYKEKQSEALSMSFNKYAIEKEALEYCLNNFRENKLEIYGQNTYGKSDEKILSILEEFSAGNEAIFKILQQSTIDKFQEIVSSTIGNKLESDGAPDISLNLKDLKVIFSKNHEGEFFINLLHNTFAYSIADEALMLMQEETFKTYCAYDTGVIHEINNEKLKDYEGKLVKKDMSLFFEIAPIASLRARISMQTTSKEDKLRLIFSSLEILHHTSLSYIDYSGKEKSIMPSTSKNGYNFDLLEKHHNEALRLDLPCRIFSFKESVRQKISEEHTEYHNFKSRDLVGQEFISSMMDGSISREDHSRYYRMTDKGYQELSRGVKIIGYKTNGDAQQTRLKRLIDDALLNYAEGDRLFEHRLRCGPGQSNVASFCEYLIVKNQLLLASDGGFKTVCPIREPKHKIVYTTNEKTGEKYLNVLLEFYTVTNIDKGDHYALSNKGVLESYDAMNEANPSNDIAKLPLISFQARIRLERKQSMSNDEILFYDFEDLNISINHRSLFLPDGALQDLEKHVVSDYKNLVCRWKGNIRCDMPRFFSGNPPRERTVDYYQLNSNPLDTSCEEHHQPLPPVNESRLDEQSNTGRITPN